jgi:colicin import membrane protein
MTTAERRPRHRWHAPERGTGPAFLISLGAHTLLFVAIAFVIRWKTEPVGPVSAELWGALPPIAEPAPPPPPPPPPVKTQRAPEPEPVKPDIALEQKKREAEAKAERIKREEEARKREEEARKQREDEERKQREEEARKKREEETRKREEEARMRRAEEAAAQKRQQAALERAMAAAGTPGAARSATAASSGLSDSYRGQIVSCIRPYIAFSVPEGLKPGQHVAEFEVNLLPSGEQVGPPRLLSASGLPLFDQAVERAIRRCDPFPRPREGPMQRTLRLAFDPVEMR